MQTEKIPCVQGRSTVKGGSVVRSASRLWQTGLILLLEFWERLRGYDKWVEAVATIE